MCYPGPVGLDPAQGAPLRPEAALGEWLQLCEHVTRAGGRILVLDPVAGELGLVRAAELGILFPVAEGGFHFLLAPRPQADDQQSQRLRPFFEHAGLKVHEAAHPFGAQADIISLQRNRFILCRGPETSEQAVAEFRSLLPSYARALEVELAPEFRHGIGCLSPLLSPAGDHVLLAYAGGLRGQTLEELGRFAGNEVELIPLAREDALRCSAGVLAVRGTVLLPTGLSASLRGLLVRRGFTLVEMDLPQLALLCGGEGARALVCELPGHVLADEAPSYAMRREELARLVHAYAAAG